MGNRKFEGSTFDERKFWHKQYEQHEWNVSDGLQFDDVDWYDANGRPAKHDGYVTQV